MISKHFVGYAVIFLIIGCSNQQVMEENNDIAKEVNDHFTSNAEEDSIKVNTLKVQVDEKKGVKALRIFWEIEEFAHTEFIIAYNEMLIRTLSEQITDQMDSIILEIQIPASDFGLKRYKANKEEVRNLKKEYKETDLKYVPILKYIMRTKTSAVLTQFDQTIEVSRRLENSMKDTSYWQQYSTFLEYLRKDFLVEKTDSIQQDAKIKIFKTFFGESAFFFSNERPLNMVNYILEMEGGSPMVFTMADTAKYGIKPSWLDSTSTSN